MKGVCFQGCRELLHRLVITVILTLAASYVFAITAAQSSPAQSYTVIHDFTAGGDGANPYTGLSIDAARNLYGTAVAGGAHGHGTIFRLKRDGAGWVLTPLYSFAGGSDGTGPQGRVTIARDGTLYGTTSAGGSSDRGTVFHLRPPAAAPKTTLSPWNETVIHAFTGHDGGLPQGDLTFDASGNLYGTTVGGGDFNWGTIYKLSPSGGGWTESVLFSARNDADGAEPQGGVVFDAAGNLYGTFQFSLGGYGTVFQLSPSGSGWTERSIYSFTFSGDDGIEPIGGLIIDSAGNLFGTTLYGGSFPAGGTAFKITPSGGGWTHQTIHSFTDGDGGPVDKLVMDADGNLYGTAFSAGAFGWGSVFKLTPSAGGWTYTALYDFTGGTDGARPMSAVVFGANGKLYGTASSGGANNYGVVWEITP